VQAHSRGGHRATERGSDLLQRHVAEIVQEQHTAWPRWDLPGRLEQALVGDVLIVCHLHTVGLDGWFEGVKQRGDREPNVPFGTGCGASEMIAPYVQGDAPRPGPQRRRASVAREAAQEVDKGFLREIVGQRIVPRAPRQPAR
jgi:hypothetical protein